jgi:GTPase SAR1 family protein
MNPAEFALNEEQMAGILKNYEKITLYPTDILKECPKFRILIIGQAGAGKTTLCGKVFGVDAHNSAEVKEVKNVSLGLIIHGTMFTDIYTAARGF